MELLALRFKPLEPLMFRDSGEFDPSSRGVYSYASSLYLPRPSTVVGILISALLSSDKVTLYKCLDIGGWEDLLEKCYIRVLDEIGIEALRGPYIISIDHRKIFIPLILEKRTWLIDYIQARYLLNEKYGDVVKELFDKSYMEAEAKATTVAKLRLIERDIMDNLHKYVLEPKSVSLVGIHLGSRNGGGKTAEEGYIYTANYISYPQDTEIVVFVLVKDSSKILNSLGKAVKLGGEGRIAKLYIERVDKSNVIKNNIVHVIISSNEKAKYAILLSPMPLKGDYKNIPFIGRYTVSGYGFSIAKRCRKPLDLQISEGSIINLDTAKREITYKETVNYSVYDVLGLAEGNNYYKYLGRLGYASFIPI